MALWSAKQLLCLLKTKERKVFYCTAIKLLYWQQNCKHKDTKKDKPQIGSVPFESTCENKQQWFFHCLAQQ